MQSNKLPLRKWIVAIYLMSTSINERVSASISTPQRGEYVRKQAHTNGIGSFWALLKRGCYGTCHRMSSKRLNRYVTEFSGRKNVRE